MRGEYIPRASERPERGELPPRARRILHSLWGDQDIVGTTSACAENTIDAEIMPASSGNYLRVRGEYSSFSSLLRFIAELPPRARRILYQLITMIFTDGTTSACAENTSPLGGTVPWRWNYLRVRGEYVIAPSSSM